MDGLECSSSKSSDRTPSVLANSWTNKLCSMWGEWIQDGGKGFLDNIHGECHGDPLSWSWEWWDDGSAHVDFLIAAEKPNVCVQNALWDASRPSGAIWGVKCCWNTYPWCETL